MSSFRFFQPATGITVTVTLFPTDTGGARASFSAESVAPLSPDVMELAILTWRDFMAEAVSGSLPDRLPPGWRVSGK